MKNLLLTIVLLSLPIFAHAQATNYNVGDTVDDFTVTDTDGVEHNLYSITASGKYVFLDFFFVECGPCQTWQATYNELYDRYGCNEGQIYCLSINNGFDNDEQVIQYEETYGGPFNHAPAVSNEGGGEAVDNNFGVNAYPTFCLINPENVIINIDIWPLTGVETFEAAFPAGFDPEPMECNVLNVGNPNTLELALYPNPVQSQNTLHVQLSQGQTGRFTVYSTIGRVLLTGAFDGNSLDLPIHLASGTYFLSIEGDKGSANMNFVVR
ncbi:MAG TPA: hypothetical protein DCZ44_03950 [Flavobacteriaceae bacterium]|nr:hypothetical protein [Flavobacteriaceae bacterium]